MILTCELCQSQFLTESDPHVIIPGPEARIYCNCQVKGDDDQRWIDQLRHEHKLYQKHLSRLRLEVKRLEEIISYLPKVALQTHEKDMAKRINELVFQNHNLKEAVEYYADDNSWMKKTIAHSDSVYNKNTGTLVGGKRAKQCLTELGDK